MSTQSIMEKFEKGIYLLKHAPRVLEIHNSRVYVHKSGPYQDEVKSLEHMDWNGERFLTPKLKGSSFGDYNLLIGMINTKYFESREKLDALYTKKHPPHLPFQNIERISVNEALKLLTVTISCNMDYYLSNRQEIDNDLGRKVKNLDVDYEDQMKYLETILFYSQAVKIFGEEHEDKVPRDEAANSQRFPKNLTFSDFRVLYFDGNQKIATARRGNFYLLFDYVTS